MKRSHICEGVSATRKSIKKKKKQKLNTSTEHRLYPDCIKCYKTTKSLTKCSTKKTARVDKFNSGINVDRCVQLGVEKYVAYP